MATRQINGDHHYLNGFQLIPSVFLLNLLANNIAFIRCMSGSKHYLVHEHDEHTIMIARLNKIEFWMNVYNFSMFKSRYAVPEN